MSFFSFFKKKESQSSCCCGKSVSPEAMNAALDAARKPAKGVKVLGSGCAKCQALEKATVEALAELGMDTAVEHVTDFAKIAAYGVMSTPALVVDGKVVLYGRVAGKDEIAGILKNVIKPT
jgi:small redox-active disulfide protein 2